MGGLHIIDFKGFVEEGGKRLPITIEISAPRQVEETGEWYCELVAPMLFHGTKKIFGIDDSQASDLAVAFISSLIGERSLYNQKGELTSL